MSTERRYELRDLAFATMMMVAFGAIVLRLYDVQIDRGDEYLEKSRENFFQQGIKTIGVRRGSQFVEIKCRRSMFFETRLNPVDRAGMAVKAHPHRQTYAQDRGFGFIGQDQLFCFGHRTAVDRDWIGGRIFPNVSWANSGEDKIDRQVDQSRAGASHRA